MFLIIKLSCVLVPVWTKVLELVAGISLKSTGCIKLPEQTKILFAAGIFLIFLLTCEILVTSVPYLSGDGLIFFCFFVVWGL